MPSVDLSPEGVTSALAEVRRLRDNGHGAQARELLDEALARITDMLRGYRWSSAVPGWSEANAQHQARRTRARELQKEAAALSAELE